MTGVVTGVVSGAAERPDRGGAGGGRGDGRFTLDGGDVPFVEGQTVGAALLAVGIRAWRRTRRQDRPRGLFCGIGVCFDCLVTIDGAPNERACLVPARDGMRVTNQEGTGHDL